MSKTKKPYVREVWAGFTSGRLHFTDMDDGWGGYGEGKRLVPCIFTSRVAANEQFKDVRRIEIREIDE